MLACTREEPPPPPPAPALPTGKVELIEAPVDGDIATFIAGEVARGALDHVPVLVYVGATWCKPCHVFHAAAEAGTLDRVLGALRFLEFDLDRDGRDLAAAGYTSEYVPLFARPRADGHASRQQTAGVATKGDYLEQLGPRLRQLVVSPPDHDL